VNQPPERHILGPVEFETSVGRVSYSVELSIGEIETEATHSVVMMTVLVRGDAAIASLHHVDRITIKEVDTEVEEGPQDE
jgi:hypothetical protein